MTSSFFEPSMNVLLFLMVKKFIYLEVLLILAGDQGRPAHRCSTVFVIHHYRNLCCGDRRAFRRSLFPNLSTTMGGHCTVFDTNMGRYVHPIASLLCFSKYDDAKTRAGDGY